MSPRRVETPEDVKEARRRLGLNQVELAKALRRGKHGRDAVSDWERGVRPIPGTVAVCIELMLELKMLREREKER